MATTTEPTTVNSDADQKASSCIPDMDELEKVFKQFDSNGDGKISASELGAVLKSMGSSCGAEELQRVMEDIDSDKDGYINLPEFAQLCRSTSNPSQELKDAFDLYDQDKNGVISSSELHLVLNRLGIKCSVDDCVKMIRSVDSDGDGNVNFAEFEKMMSTKLAAANNVSGS